MFGCIIPELSAIVEKTNFIAQATLLAEVIPEPVDPTDTTDPNCVENCEAGETKEEGEKAEEHLVISPALFPYYIKTSEGPYLQNAFFDRSSTTTLFQVQLGQSFDWIYDYGDRLGNDVRSWEWELYNRTTTEDERLNATINFGQSGYFIFGTVYKNTRQIRIGFKDFV